jgi:ABC-type uncharacterized transport system ATPase subunit
MSNVVPEIKALTYRFDGFAAVDKSSFSVKGGDVFGLLGSFREVKTTPIENWFEVISPSGNTDPD